MRKTPVKQSAKKRGVADARPPESEKGSTIKLPATAEDLASTAKDLVALRISVVEAAGMSTFLWFSYLFVLLYLLKAVWSVERLFGAQGSMPWKVRQANSSIQIDVM